MAEPITFKSIAAPDFGGALESIRRAGKDFSGAVSGVGDSITETAEGVRDQETDAFISKLNSLGSDQERAALIEQANAAFLDLNRVGAARTAAQNQDIRVDTNQREEELQTLRVEGLQNQLDAAALNLNADALNREKSINESKKTLYEQGKLEESNIESDIVINRFQVTNSIPDLNNALLAGKANGLTLTRPTQVLTEALENLNFDVSPEDLVSITDSNGNIDTSPQGLAKLKNGMLNRLSDFSSLPNNLLDSKITDAIARSDQSLAFSRTKEKDRTAVQINDGEKLLTSIPRGPKRTAALNQLVKDLKENPDIGQNVIKQRFQSFFDEQLADTPLQIGTLDSPENINTIQMPRMSSTATPTVFNAYETKLKNNIKRLYPNASDTAVLNSMNKILSADPNYIRNKEQSLLIEYSKNKVQDVTAVEQAKIAQVKSDFRVKVSELGSSRAITDELQKIGGVPGVSPGDLNAAVNTILNNVRAIYRNEATSPAAQAELDFAVFKMFSGSREDNLFWIGNKIVEGSGGTGRFWWEDSIEDLTGDKLMQAISPYLPTKLREGEVFKAFEKDSALRRKLLKQKQSGPGAGFTVHNDLTKSLTDTPPGQRSPAVDKFFGITPPSSAGAQDPLPNPDNPNILQGLNGIQDTVNPNRNQSLPKNLSVLERLEQLSPSVKSTPVPEEQLNQNKLDLTKVATDLLTTGEKTIQNSDDLSEFNFNIRAMMEQINAMKTTEDVEESFAAIERLKKALNIN